MKLMFDGKEYFGPRGPAGPDGNPIGAVISYMGTTAPKDYLICDGAEYNIADYADLADFFRQQFGSANHFGGDGTDTFAVPDLRDLSIQPSSYTPVNAAVLYCIKAVDSSFEGGLYSTQEQVVGRWIDGKPLYKRTVSGMTPNSASVNKWMTVDSWNIDSVCNIYGVVYSGLDTGIVPINITRADNSLLLVGISLNKQYIQLFALSDSFQSKSFYATIEYTKTTDQASIELPAMLSAQTTPTAAETGGTTEIQTEEV